MCSFPFYCLSCLDYFIFFGLSTFYSIFLAYIFSVLLFCLFYFSPFYFQSDFLSTPFSILFFLLFNGNATERQRKHGVFFIGFWGGWPPRAVFFEKIDGSPRLKEWNQKKTYLCAHSPKKHWWLWLHWRWTHCDCSKIFIEKKPWEWENWGFENTEGEMLTAFHIAVMFTFFGQAGFFFRIHGSLLEPLVML